MEALHLWAPIAVAAAALVWNVWLVRQGARKEALEKLGARIDNVEGELRQHQADGSSSRAKIADRLTQIEGRLEHLPDANSSRRTEVALAEMQGKLDVLTERLKPVAATAERVHEFLLEEAKARREAR